MASKNLIVSALILNWALFSSTNENSFGQKLPSDEQWTSVVMTQPSLTEYFIGPSGDLIASLKPDGTLVSIEEMFVGSAVRNELRLTDDQVEKIQGILSKQEEELRLILDGRGKKTVADVLDEQDQPEIDAKKVKKIFDKIFAVYRPEQKRRLREVQLNLLISHVGFENLLRQPSIRDALGLSRERAESINIRKLTTQIRKQEVELIEEALDTWLEILDEEQRVAFDKVWGSEILKPGGLALLALQLNVTEFDVESEDLGDAFNNFPECRFRILPIETPLNERKKYGGDYHELKKLDLLIYFARTFFAKGNLEIVEFQSDELKKIHREWSDEVLEINGEIGEKHDVPFRMMPIYESGSEEPIGERKSFEWEKHPELTEVIRGEMNRRADKFTKKVEAVFLPHQKDAIREVANDFRVRVSGPLVDLIDGKLGVKLELTNDQKTALKRKAQSVRKTIISKSTELHEKSLEELILALPKPDQAKLRAALGVPLRKCFVDPNRFAIVLESQQGAPRR